MDMHGSILRQARRRAGLSVLEMSRRAGISTGHVSNIESGTRRATTPVVEAYIRVLGDNVRRRAVLMPLAAAAATGIAVGLPELADLVRRGFEDHRDISDWEQVVARFEDEFPHLPPDLGGGLIAHLMIVQRTIHEQGGTPATFRAAASLARLWGLWLGNAGRLAEGKLWYETATGLAERSGYRELMAKVLATVANRGPYERFPIRDSLARADQALHLHSGPAVSTVEAYGAKVHIHALTGDLEAGRTAVAAMRRAADGMDGDAGQRAASRALLFSTYLESRIGPADDAHRVFAEAEPALSTVQPWLIEAQVYLARNAAIHGDPAGGVERALKIVEDYRRDVRVLGIAVRDLADAVPTGWTSPELVELRRYEDPHPGPWKTLR